MSEVFRHLFVFRIIFNEKKILITNCKNKKYIIYLKYLYSAYFFAHLYIRQIEEFTLLAAIILLLSIFRIKNLPLAGITLY